MRLTVAAEWLNSCAGCEMSLLNMGEDFIACLRILSFVHMPMLIDHKYFEPMGEKIGFEFPEADLGIISGGIRNEEHLAIAEEMRRKCRVIVAMGTCATHGGIPALINMFSNDELFRRYYRTTVATDAADTPAVVVPPLLDRTYALDEKIRVDVHLPGCPPHPDHISAVLTALMNGEQPRLPTKSVCDTCPARREGKGAVQKMRRYTRNPRHQADKPLTEMKCLLENGLLCMGPVTRAGCAGEKGEAPQCIRARVPCRGCYGPVQKNGNQLLDMLNALASNGIDIRSLPDRQAFLRFSGAHGRLNRPGWKTRDRQQEETAAPESR